MKTMNKYQKILFTFIPIGFACGISILLMNYSSKIDFSVNKCVLLAAYLLIVFAGFFAIKLQILMRKNKNKVSTFIDRLVEKLDE